MYHRLVFVNHPRHVEAADGEDGDLLVSSNWLLWQECLHRGLHCVNLDEGILGWHDAVETANHHVREANRWFQSEGNDVTLFRGISLGRNLVTPSGQVWCDYRRLHRAVTTLAARYGAREAVFHDCRLENGFLDDAARFAAFEDIAAAAGLRLIDRRDQLSETDPEIPQSYGHGPTRSGGTLRALAVRGLTRMFEITWGTASRLVRMANPGRPAVLLATSPLTSVPLLEKFDGRGLVPICYAKWFPRKKDFRFLLRAMACGVMVAWRPAARLTAKDRREIATLGERLRQAWAKNPADGAEAAVRRYIDTHMLEGGRFEELAREVKTAAAMLRAFRPQLMFTDGHQNATINIFMQTAKRFGIRTAATWHSILVYDLRQENVGANPEVAPWVDRCLTWGRHHEDWLAAVGARAEFRRTGYLSSERPCPQTRGLSARPRVLVLQYVSSYTELAAPHTTEYGCLVEMVRMLNDLGHREIRVKCHPGAPKTAYYQRVIETFALDCTVHADGLFRDYAEWADIVIGPPYTGAMLEAIALGRPYYIFCTPPNSVNRGYVRDGRVFESVGELRQALETGQIPDNDAVLEYFTSATEITEPAKMLWAALTNEATTTGRESVAARSRETVPIR